MSTCRKAIQSVDRADQLSERYVLKRDNPPPKVKAGSVSKGQVHLDPVGPDNQFHNSIFESLGTADADLTQYLIRQACGVVLGESEFDRRTNVALAQLHDISPKDSVESMLAVQMIGVHNLAVECMRRAALPNQTVQGAADNIAQATKLMRTFTAQVEALDRHRGKGQQKVTVEHVHVNNGGQAIVGSMTGRGSGTGG